MLPRGLRAAKSITNQTFSVSRFKRASIVVFSKELARFSIVPQHPQQSSFADAPNILKAVSKKPRNESRRQAESIIQIRNALRVARGASTLRYPYGTLVRNAQHKSNAILHQNPFHHGLPILPCAWGDTFRANRQKSDSFAMSTSAQAATTSKKSSDCKSHTHANGGDGTEAFVKPSLEDAMAMPLSMGELDNEAVFKLCALGAKEALAERLVREVMRVEQIEHEEALAKLEEMGSIVKNNSTMYLPHKIGLVTAGVCSLAALPLVFSEQVTLWFNDVFVTIDVPEARDMETWLEIGAWSWGWMEPPLGTISFCLLCLRFARNQLVNIRVTPYTDHKKLEHAAAVAARYPQYRQNIVREWALRNA